MQAFRLGLGTAAGPLLAWVSSAGTSLELLVSWPGNFTLLVSSLISPDNDRKDMAIRVSGSLSWQSGHAWLL
jgi:hypothetical protein